MLALLSVWSKVVDLHMAQLMPLPLTVSCSSKIQIGFTFLVPAHPGSSGQRVVKRVCVRVCVCVCVCVLYRRTMLCGVPQDQSSYLHRYTQPPLAAHSLSLCCHLSSFIRVVERSIVMSMSVCFVIRLCVCRENISGTVV